MEQAGVGDGHADLVTNGAENLDLLWMEDLAQVTPAKDKSQYLFFEQERQQYKRGNALVMTEFDQPFERTGHACGLNLQFHQSPLETEQRLAGISQKSLVVERFDELLWQVH